MLTETVSEEVGEMNKGYSQKRWLYSTSSGVDVFIEGGRGDLLDECFGNAWRYEAHYQAKDSTCVCITPPTEKWPSSVYPTEQQLKSSPCFHGGKIQQAPLRRVIITQRTFTYFDSNLPDETPDEWIGAR